MRIHWLFPSEDYTDDTSRLWPQAQCWTFTEKHSQRLVRLPPSCPALPWRSDSIPPSRPHGLPKLASPFPSLDYPCHSPAGKPVLGPHTPAKSSSSGSSSPAARRARPVPANRRQLNGNTRQDSRVLVPLLEGPGKHHEP